MQYFLPFWPGDDIYEQFDPWNDTYAGKQKRIWECFDKPPFNGILVSRVNVERTNGLKKKAEKDGIHSALGFHGPIIGDCGAFSYVNESKPPYDSKPTLEFYKKFGFDIGVTVDHLIVKNLTRDKMTYALTEAEREERWKLTIKNAKEMLDEAKKSEYEKIRLIGVTQGWDPKSYAEGVHELLNYGFDYVGLGGLVRKPTSAIKSILFSVHNEVQKCLKRRKKKSGIGSKIGLHLFGIARPNLFPTMIHCGVTSFDSASPLRVAWASANKNYMLNEEFYSAVRIRKAKSNEEKIKEQAVLLKLQKLDRGEISSSEFLDCLDRYDSHVSASRRECDARTLNCRPWKQCDCPICKEIGLHVCIFRGCERNMRRGFHNVYQFSKLLGHKYPRILALTWCTSEKSTEKELMPAYKRYSPSQIFRTFWENVRDLPVEVGILSAKYMLINWDTRIAKYDERLGAEKHSEAVNNLDNQFRFYDKVFFMGLGAYREAVEKAAYLSNVLTEVYPKFQLSRGKLDIIEYNRQMKYFREAIMNEVKPYLELQQKMKETECKDYEQTKLSL